jgi:hypothetical protein
MMVSASESAFALAVSSLAVDASGVWCLSPFVAGDGEAAWLSLRVSSSTTGRLIGTPSDKAETTPTSFIAPDLKTDRSCPSSSARSRLASKAKKGTLLTDQPESDEGTPCNATRQRGQEGGKKDVAKVSAEDNGVVGN